MLKLLLEDVCKPPNFAMKPSAGMRKRFFFVLTHYVFQGYTLSILLFYSSHYFHRQKRVAMLLFYQYLQQAIVQILLPHIFQYFRMRNKSDPRAHQQPKMRTILNVEESLKVNSNVALQCKLSLSFYDRDYSLQILVRCLTKCISISAFSFWWMYYSFI